MKFIIVILLLVLSPLPAIAACTTSDGGMTYTCGEGTTVAQINTVLSAASAGATVNFAAGNYTWNSAISFNNLSGRGISLIGAPNKESVVNISGGSFSYTNWGTNNNLLRISGFTFNNAGTSFIWLYGYRQLAILTNFRFDNNTVNATAGTTNIRFGEGSDGATKIEGVIDNNIFQTSSNSARYIAYHGYGDLRYSTWDANALLGTNKNLFIEDNSFLNYTQNDVGLGCLDSNWGAAVVLRNNYAENCSFKAHGIYNNWSWGTQNYEVYRNDIRNTSGSNTNGTRAIHHQGSGTFLVWGNVVHTGSAASSSIIDVLNYRSFTATPELCDGSSDYDGNRTPVETYAGYPCYKQLGRTIDATLYPAYSWQNALLGGSLINISVHSGGTYHLWSDRDYYNSVSANAQTSQTSPFNGTTGMGFGTLANRPTTCTPTAEALDAGYGGVGYFATDIGSQGTLYNCSSTDTWEVYYTPYTYPHPLRGEGDPDPVCSPSRRDLCDDTNCETTGEGYWYNGTCNATPESTPGTRSGAPRFGTGKPPAVGGKVPVFAGDPI